MADIGHNSFRVSRDELRALVERLEKLDAEKREITEMGREVMAEAKARGYDTKIIRKVVALRKRDKDDVAEEQAVLDLYCDALGVFG